LGELQLHHNDNPLSSQEKEILSVFAEMRVPAGVSVPGDIISARLARGGYVGGVLLAQWETAMVTLEARGFIQPGENPFTAITWRLTPRGHAFVHNARGPGLGGS
jgi:hypothetical protein